MEDVTKYPSPREGIGVGAQYIDLYRQARDLICQHSSDVMNAQRDDAFEQFKSKGFPTRKEERYKYTNVQELFAPDYGLNLNRFQIPVNPYDAFRCDVPNLSTLLYFVVNDGFYEDALPKASLPEGVIVGSLSKNAHLIGDYYNRLAANDDAVSSLNTMLAQDGLLVYVPRGVVVDRAIQVINILKTPFASLPAGEGQGAGASFMVNRRVLVVAEEGSAVTLLFCDHTADDLHFLTTQVTEVFAMPGSTVNLYCLEETHVKNVRVSNVYVEQQANSHVTHNVITLHNGTTRNRLDLHFRGEGAECWLGGCVIADKQQHVDNNTLVVHHVPHCDSHELYKYVLDNDATGAFAGRVLVEHGAQQTSSEMRNQNLCASREARMYTQPMLEIYADDVKCSHGSTVGQLNDAALFYMRQRGITEREARLLLQQAFVTEVIDAIALEPLRDRLRYLVDKRFRGELSKCEGCKLCR
ncbi:MAG: Fe-S cluster assembly protein SufD [Prevotella sp.]|nr:Fe-S cluster assembly protein SufD [Prevotella sp.]